MKKACDLAYNIPLASLVLPTPLETFITAATGKP